MATLGETCSLNLFPIENRMSPRALAALSCDAVNRYPYSETPDTVYGDVSGLAAVYEYCAELGKTYFGARHAFVQFLSGLHTMHTVLTALAAPGDRVMIMDPSCGGHYATAVICRGYGYQYRYVPFDRTSCQLDIEALAASCADVDLIYLDMSTLLRLPDARALRWAAPHARICLDASHIFGLLPATGRTLVLDGGFDSISGSTHKTLPGPQKGMLVTNQDSVADRLAARIPYTASSPHSASIGALAITLEELMPHRVEYATQIVANARALAASLVDQGFDVAGSAFGYTDTHQVWVHPPASVGTHTWSRCLTAARIRSTTVVLPSSGLTGLRIGVQELTRTGMCEEDMLAVADLLGRLLLRHESPDEVIPDVVDLVRSFPDVHFATQPTAVVAH
ncbi:aminotransferase class I/II-fold pyridoxal phosphate-dependent enzyme [Saccharothrix sp.]|uniref:aminotransferase class I/II-fold pyridoxal phosphate-dependent enzyme n=1 Tax=Saccharothrix sp. TaxID=1873460 RepID=UPI002810BCEA|nr:aminotransferase class I/II-fold pyridoxal phosphate-dependent enzyme [Saccharothrix sp.]